VFTLRMLLLVMAVVACGTAAPMIRASSTAPVLVAAYRLLIAALLLSPAYLRARRRHPLYPPGDLCRQAAPAAVLLALHFWSWNSGVHMTAIANASLIVNLVPVAMPFIIWFMLRERINRTEAIGTAVALAGTFLLAMADYHLSLRSFLGDIICFGSMLTFAVYLAWNRRAHVPTIWLYVPLVYLFAGLLCLLVGLATADSILITSRREALLMIGLALIPTITGHTLLNVSMRSLPSQLVAITNLGQFIPAGILAWFIFHEAPTRLFPLAVALVIGGALTAILGHRKAPSTH
jgi:drug/metabolite transporter (DMT)-like permease